MSHAPIQPCSTDTERRLALEALCAVLAAAKPVRVRHDLDWDAPGCVLCGDRAPLRTVHHDAMFTVSQCRACGAVEAHLIESERRWYRASDLRAALRDRATDPSRVEESLMAEAEWLEER